MEEHSCLKMNTWFLQRGSYLEADCSFKHDILWNFQKVWLEKLNLLKIKIPVLDAFNFYVLLDTVQENGKLYLISKIVGFMSFKNGF